MSGLAVDSTSNAPIVLLKERDGDRVLPIWIGVVEASAIAFELEAVKPARPMTHDLLRGVVEAMGGRISGATVTELRDNTYFAVIDLERDGQRIEMDARPSDAVALALRAGAPVFCNLELLERGAVTAKDLQAARERGEQNRAAQVDRPAAEEPSPEGPRPLVLEEGPVPQDLLESLPPEDFGKYKM